MAETDVLNMSLDDIIREKDAKPKGSNRQKRGRSDRGSGTVRIAVNKAGIKKNTRGGFRGRSYGQKGEGARLRDQYNNDAVTQPRNPDALNGDAAWEHDLYDEGQPQARRVRPATQGFKILITNLDYKVTDDDIQELFENCGSVLKAGILYDRSGRSEEAAEVIFQRREEAMAAVKQYNNLALDNKPMKIELVEDTNGARMLSSGLRLGSKVQTRAPQQIRPSGRQPRFTGAKRSNGVRQARGRGAAVSMTDLDKDLDTYMAAE